MNKLLSLTIPPLMLLASCASLGQAAGDTTRQAAKQVVRPIVAAQFPGVPTDIVVDCVIDNATGSELVSLATSAATADTAGATQTTISIATRPETARCIANGSGNVLDQFGLGGLSGLLGGTQ